MKTERFEIWIFTATLMFFSMAVIFLLLLMQLEFAVVKMVGMIMAIILLPATVVKIRIMEVVHWSKRDVGIKTLKKRTEDIYYVDCLKRICPKGGVGHVKRSPAIVENLTRLDNKRVVRTNENLILLYQ